MYSQFCMLMPPSLITIYAIYIFVVVGLVIQVKHAFSLSFLYFFKSGRFSIDCAIVPLNSNAYSL